MHIPSVTQVARLTGHAGAVYALETAPGNSIVYSGSSDHFISAWDLEKNEQQLIAKLPSAIYSLLTVNNGRFLLAGTAAGMIHFIDLPEKKENVSLQHHTGAVFDLVHSTVHNLIFASSGDGSISVIDSGSLSLLSIKKLCAEKIRGLALDPLENTLAAACGDGKVRLFSLPAMEETGCLDAHLSSANCVCFHPSGKFLLTGGKDAHLNIWEIPGYRLARSIPAHNFALYDIVFSPATNYFATASRDKMVKIWDAESMEVLVRLDREKYSGHLNSVNRLLWSKQNDLLMSTGDDRSILLWKIG